MKRAWRTKAYDVESIVSAETRAQAVATTLRSALDVGYPVKWTDVVARRASEHDAWAAQDSSRQCWGERYLPSPPGEVPQQ